MSGDVSAARDAWRAMRSLVLDLNDRRAAVAGLLGMSFIRAKAVHQLADRSMTMSELAVGLAIDAPHATVVVDDLEQRGLVRRHPHPTDRRVRVARLTPSGRQAAGQVATLLDKPPAGFDVLEPGDLAELLRILNRLIGVVAIPTVPPEVG